MGCVRSTGSQGFPYPARAARSNPRFLARPLEGTGAHRNAPGRRWGPGARQGAPPSSRPRVLAHPGSAAHGPFLAHSSALAGGRPPRPVHSGPRLSGDSAVVVRPRAGGSWRSGQGPSEPTGPSPGHSSTRPERAASHGAGHSGDSPSAPPTFVLARGSLFTKAWTNSSGPMCRSRSCREGAEWVQEGRYGEGVPTGGPAVVPQPLVLHSGAGDPVSGCHRARAFPAGGSPSLPGSWGWGAMLRGVSRETGLHTR